MRIRFLVLSLLVLCLAVSGCQQTQEPAVKVGVVDMNRLLRDSEPGKEASRFLEGMQKEIQQQIDDVQARLGKDPENENLQRELQAIYMGGQQRINAEQQNVVSQLLDLTQRLVNNYRKANGLSVLEDVCDVSARLVVNRVDKTMLSILKLTIDDVMDSAGLPLLGIVLEDPDVPMAAACGMSLLRYNKRASAAGSFYRIARRIQGYPEPIKIR